MNANQASATIAFILTVFSSYGRAQSNDAGSPNNTIDHADMRQPDKTINQRVQLKPISTNTVQAGTFSYQFKLIDTKNNNSITDRDLVIDSEKLLHFFLFDPALIEFRHLHPIFNGTYWSVDGDLPVNGIYWIWVEGELESDKSNFFSSARLFVQGGKSEHQALPLVDVRTGNNSGSIATLSQNTISAKKMTMLTLTLSRQDGSQPELSNYLGKKAHIVVVPSDGSSLIHVHAMETLIPNQMIVHTEFPYPGKFRVWIQFIDGGLLKTIPLTVSVVD